MSATVSVYAGLGTASLSRSTDDGYTIHGVAIGKGDLTVGQSGTPKIWPGEELRDAADTLEGQPLVKDHQNNVEGRIGTVTEAAYAPGTGVIYEAEIASQYEDIAEDIRAGILDVSPRIHHAPTEELDEHEETGALVAENLFFDNLSVVYKGASPSNTAVFGESPMFSPEAGMATAASAPAEASSGVPADVETAVLQAGSERPDVEDVVAELEHGTKFHSGDYVKWEWGDGTAYGRVEDSYVDEGEVSRTIDNNEVTRDSDEEPVYVLDVWREGDESYDGIALKYESKLSAWDAPEAAEMEAGAPQYTEGMMVQWQVEPDLFGKVVHVDRERKIVMVDIHERRDGELVSTGFTISAGYSDLHEMSDDEMAAVGTDEPSVIEQLEEDEDSLDEVYSEWNDHVNMSASELKQWAGNPCAQHASVDPKAVISRNLELLETPKEDWTSDHVEDAKRTISFISRMSDSSNEPEDPKDGPYGCPSEWAISLLNWAYNPFSSVPSTPEGYDGGEEGYDAESLSVTTDDMPSDGTETQDGDGGESEVATLANDYEMHQVEYDGTTEGEWDRPALEDFLSEMDADAESWDDLTEDQRSSIEDHFFIAEGGFPAENYGDLNLPAVEPNGDLSLSALRTIKGGHGAQAVEGLSDEMESKVIEAVNDLAKQAFDEDWDSEEMAHINGLDINGLVNWSDGDQQKMGTIEDVRHEDGEVFLEVAVMDRKDGSFQKTGEMVTKTLTSVQDEMASGSPVHVATVQSTAELRRVTNSSFTHMHELEYESVDDEELGNYDAPVVVEEDELEKLRDEAEQAGAVEEELSELRNEVGELAEAREIIEALDEEELELLRGDEDHTVVDATEYEELQEAVDEVVDVYAEELAKHNPTFEAEELAEQMGPRRLHEKFEAHDEAELSAAVEEEPEPEAGAVDSEELEQSKDEAEQEELEEAARERVADELESKGWERQAEKVRAGEYSLDELGVSVETED